MPVLQDRIASRKLDYERDKDDVTAFLIRNQAYLIYQDERDVDEATTKEVFYGELPATHTYEDKQIIGYFLNGELIGLVDILKHYPKPDTWVTGLMLIEASKRRQGIGRMIYQQTEAYLLDNEARVARLGVLEDNIVGKSFWKANGFLGTGAFRWHADKRKILVYEKVIA